MKNRSTGRLGRLLNVVIPECFYRGSQPLKNTTRFPIATFGNDARRGYLRGFTLIELLVVVLIIGILSAIALPQYTAAVEKSRVTEALQNIATIEKQIDLYILENGLPNTQTKYNDYAAVKLAGGYWDGNSYVTKNFEYSLVGTSMEVMRTPDRNNLLYTLYSDREPGAGFLNNNNPTGNWYHTCVTQLEEIGRKTCKQLEAQGWKYVDSEM